MSISHWVKPNKLLISPYQITKQGSRSINIKNNYEKALPGFDVELGHAFTDSITGYAGGYYFSAANADTVSGPKIRINYNYNKLHGRILGVLDGVSLETGAQHDKSRGYSAYVGIKFKLGLTDFAKNSNLFGFERHMVELVRRDPDIVVKERITVDEILNVIQQSSYNYNDDGKYSGNKSDYKKADTKERRKLLLEQFGLSEDVTWQDVREKRKEYVLKYHPDKNITQTKEYIQNAEDNFYKYENIYKEIEKLKDLFVTKESKIETESYNNSSNPSSRTGFKKDSNKNTATTKTKKDFKTTIDLNNLVKVDDIPNKKEVEQKDVTEIRHCESPKATLQSRAFWNISSPKTLFTTTTHHLELIKSFVTKDVAVTKIKESKRQLQQKQADKKQIEKSEPDTNEITKQQEASENTSRSRLYSAFMWGVKRLVGCIGGMFFTPGIPMVGCLIGGAAIGVQASSTLNKNKDLFMQFTPNQVRNNTRRRKNEKDSDDNDEVDVIDANTIKLQSSPTVSDFTKTGFDDTRILFTVSEFEDHFTGDDSLSDIKFASLPEHGTLRLNNYALALNDEVNVNNITSLAFIPENNWYGNTTFSYLASDEMSYSQEPADVNIEITKITRALIDPVLVGSVSTGGTATELTIEGNYLYMASWEAGLEIIDITNVSNPSLITTLSIGDYSNEGELDGNYLYMANEYGLMVIDVTNPAIPVLITSLETYDDARGITLIENYAYVADGFSGLKIFEITNVTEPYLVANVPIDGYLWSGVTVVEEHAYLLDSYSGLKIFDITNITAPVLIGDLSVEDTFYTKPIVQGNYAYVADGDFGFNIYNITNRAEPSLLSSLSMGSANAVWVADNYAYIADYDQGLNIVNITDLTNLDLLKKCSYYRSFIWNNCKRKLCISCRRR